MNNAVKVLWLGGGSKDTERRNLGHDIFGNDGVDVNIKGEWNDLSMWCKLLKNNYEIITFDNGSESWFIGDDIEENFKYYVNNSTTTSFVFPENFQLLKNEEIFPYDKFDRVPLGYILEEKGMSNGGSYYYSIRRTFNGIKNRNTFFSGKKIYVFSRKLNEIEEYYEGIKPFVPLFTNQEDLIIFEQNNLLTFNPIITDGNIYTNNEYFQKQLNDFRIGREEYIENIGLKNIMTPIIRNKNAKKIQNIYISHIKKKKELIEKEEINRKLEEENRELEKVKSERNKRRDFINLLCERKQIEEKKTHEENPDNKSFKSKYFKSKYLKYKLKYLKLKKF